MLFTVELMFSSLSHFNEVLFSEFGGKTVVSSILRPDSTDLDSKGKQYKIFLDIGRKSRMVYSLNSSDMKVTQVDRHLKKRAMAEMLS